MATIGEIPTVFKAVGIFGFLKRVVREISSDNISTWGSAMAYSWLFAIFPFLIFMLSLVPLIPNRFKTNLKPRIESAIVESVPSKDAATIIKDQAFAVLDSPRFAAKSFLSIGLALTIWGASRGVAMTMAALDIAYDVEIRRPFWKQSLYAIALTLIVSVLVIAVMILMPIGTGIIGWLIVHATEWIPQSRWLLVLVNVARYAIALFLLFAITATFYHFGPNTPQSERHAFRFITPGAVFTISVWLLLGFFFRLYITRFGGEANYNKTYGAVAGLVILLLFFYIDSLVLLIGAEINSEIDCAMRNDVGKSRAKADEVTNAVVKNSAPARL